MTPIDNNRQVCPRFKTHAIAATLKLLRKPADSDSWNGSVVNTSWFAKWFQHKKMNETAFKKQSDSAVCNFNHSGSNVDIGQHVLCEPAVQKI